MYCFNICNLISFPWDCLFNYRTATNSRTNNPDFTLLLQPSSQATASPPQPQHASFQPLPPHGSPRRIRRLRRRFAGSGPQAPVRWLWRLRRWLWWLRRSRRLWGRIWRTHGRIWWIWQILNVGEMSTALLLWTHGHRLGNTNADLEIQMQTWKHGCRIGNTEADFETGDADMESGMQTWKHGTI